ncbi:MAG: DsbA family protein [Parcubacteria group bacterium]
MSDVELLQKKNFWYKRWWGIILIILAFGVVIFLPFYIYQFIVVYNQMQSGTYMTTDMENEKPPYDMKLLIDDLTPSVGNGNATVSIVEFGDFNCHNTLLAYPIMQQLMTKYHDQVKFYWRNYPVVSEDSPDLAAAAICANRQGKFWPFHDRLFEVADTINALNLDMVAESVGMNIKEFEACIGDSMTAAQLRKDYYAATDGEVQGTPTFFINGYKIPGVLPLATWDGIIQQFLKIKSR